jgi:hypothetical protein
MTHLAFSSHLASSVDAARTAAHGFIPANDAQVEGWKKVCFVLFDDLAGSHITVTYLRIIRVNGPA